MSSGEDRAYDYGSDSGSPLRDAVGALNKNDSSAFGTVSQPTTFIK